MQQETRNFYPVNLLKPNSVIILMYHKIFDPESHDDFCDRDPIYDISLEAFNEQMDYLDKKGFRVLSLDRFLECKDQDIPLPEKSVILTFDDSSLSHVRMALPLLKRYRFHAEFFLTVEQIGESGFLNWDEVSELQKAGMGIGSHGVRHIFFNDLNPEIIEYELKHSKECLEIHLNSAVRFFAPPGGRINNTVTLLAKKIGYKGICTSRLGLNNLKADSFSLKRIPIKYSVPMSTFTALVNQERSALWPLQSKTFLLDRAKKFLGNKKYDKIREKLIVKAHPGG